MSPNYSDRLAVGELTIFADCERVFVPAVRHFQGFAHKVIHFTPDAVLDRSSENVVCINYSQQLASKYKIDSTVLVINPTGREPTDQWLFRH